MLQDDLMGINTNSSQTPENVFGAYFVDVSKSKESKNKKIVPNIEGQPEGYEELPDFYSQDTSQHSHDNVNSKPLPIQSIAGFIDSLLAPPTYTPKKFSEQVKIVKGDDQDRVYLYERISKQWEWIELNKVNYETVQLQLPANAAGDFGWDVIGTGADSVWFANGAEIYSSSFEYAFLTDVLDYNGVLTFANSRKLKLETAVTPRFTDATNVQAIGFYENNIDTVADFVDKTNVTTCIKWVMDGSDLYAVVADGATGSSTTIPLVVVAAGSPLRLKIIWEPGVSIKWFVNDVLLYTETSIVPTLGSLYFMYAGLSANVGNAGFYAQFPKLSLEI